MQPKLSPAGDRALLVELGEVTAAHLHASALVVRSLGGVLACIAGQDSLYVIFEGEPQAELVTRALADAAASDLEPRRHVIEVSFAAEHAPDLPELLDGLSIRRDEFLDRVRALRLTARYLGFRAGFAYLDGWPDDWRLPRRPTSRLRVPRGSFAIAGPGAGFYSIDSPGGWNILGCTAAPLWDARRDPPNLIAAGDEVVIVPVERLGAMPDIAESLPPPEIAGIEIVTNAQFATTVGRTDWHRVEHGLPSGGAFDEESAIFANRLSGNGDDAPLLECAMVVPRLRFHRDAVVAWCGADCELPQATAMKVNAGEEIGGGRIRNGLRGWLAIGATSRGDHGAQARGPGAQALSLSLEPPVDRLRAGASGGAGALRTIGAVAGPHATPLHEITCEVTAQLNRIGIRIRPLDPIAFPVPADLPSCGMQCGTIQLHPDGTLVAMGPDHPITGGYLQPMTVRWDERWKLAQLAPGDRVVFVCS
jgi:KipI family sensor histidine kinase inhibitor